LTNHIRIGLCANN